VLNDDSRDEFEAMPASQFVVDGPELEKTLRPAYDIKEAAPDQEVILTVHELKRLARSVTVTKHWTENAHQTKTQSYRSDGTARYSR
jgi:hypothetical protein